jgi:hypothetical protein
MPQQSFGCGENLRLVLVVFALLAETPQSQETLEITIEVSGHKYSLVKVIEEVLELLRQRLEVGVLWSWLR